jgi:hypothetical protein
LTRTEIAELFQITPQNVTIHVKDIYATAIDYDSQNDAAQLFFKKVQNKM